MNPLHQRARQLLALPPLPVYWESLQAVDVLCAVSRLDKFPPFDHVIHLFAHVQKPAPANKQHIICTGCHKEVQPMKKPKICEIQKINIQWMLANDLGRHVEYFFLITTDNAYIILRHPSIAVYTRTKHVISCQSVSRGLWCAPCPACIHNASKHPWVAQKGGRWPKTCSELLVRRLPLPEFRTVPLGSQRSFCGSFSRSWGSPLPLAVPSNQSTENSRDSHPQLAAQRTSKAQLMSV